MRLKRREPWYLGMYVMISEVGRLLGSYVLRSTRRYTSGDDLAVSVGTVMVFAAMA